MGVPISTYVGAPHPECRSDELFLTYANETGFEIIGHASKRKGQRVFNAVGKDVTKECPDVFPVFVTQEDVRNIHPGYFALCGT